MKSHKYWLHHDSFENESHCLDKLFLPILQIQDGRSERNQNKTALVISIYL